MKNAVELSMGVVISRSDMQTASAIELSNFFNRIICLQKRVKVVDNIQKFFSAKSLDEAIRDADMVSVRMIAEKRGLIINEDELLRIKNFKLFRDELAARERSIPVKYNFAEVPAGWTVENELSITKRGVYRKKSSAAYTFGIKGLENLWKTASRVWSGDVDAEPSISVRASGYSRTAMIGETEIAIGCQSIKRFELEQLAVNQGWKLPG